MLRSRKTRTSSDQTTPRCNSFARSARLSQASLRRKQLPPGRAKQYRDRRPNLPRAAAAKAKVIGGTHKIEQLRQLQSEVDLRREQYKKTAQKAADLTLESGIADSGLSSVRSGGELPITRLFQTSP